MPKRRLTLAAVTAAAVDVTDSDGFEALALASVAKKLDVAVSSLYTYTDGVDGLRYHVAVAATNQLTDIIRNAAIGAAGADALHSIAIAYRRFAIDHPGQFASTLLPPKIEDDELAAANAALLGVFILVFEAIGLELGDARRAALAIRSAIHGFLALEDKTSPAATHDDDYVFLLDALHRGLLHADL